MKIIVIKYLYFIYNIYHLEKYIFNIFNIDSNLNILDGSKFVKLSLGQVRIQI